MPGVLILGWVLLNLVGCGSRGPAPVDGWDWKGPVPKGYYLVRSGDTLSEIAQEQRISSRDLIRWNRLKPPYTIYAGKLLRVAPVDGRAAAATQSPPRQGSGRGKAPPAISTQPSTEPGSGGAESGLTWSWPLDGSIRQGFRAGDRTRQGLRIACRPGDTVHAAAGGQVVYGGSGLKGYGNLIIVKHNERYLSAYGFNRRLLVAEGNSVKRGQALAECGQGPDGIHLLHFEIRRDGAAVDPVPYLPPRA
ncbi:MAG: peptidoglycan DD-metalloendopeptidase family protein [Bdellovibrio bacteriovorus]